MRIHYVSQMVAERASTEEAKNSTTATLLQAKSSVETLQKKLKKAEDIRGQLTTALNQAKDELKEKDATVADVNCDSNLLMFIWNNNCTRFSYSNNLKMPQSLRRAPKGQRP